jgi:GNAT superfamily N-acetyltransferase
MRLEPGPGDSYVHRVDSTSARIEVWREPSQGTSLRVASDFGSIVRSERLPGVLNGVAASGGVVIAALSGDVVRGYVTLVPSSALALERWENLPDTFELGSIEVARSLRRHGVGTELLARLHTTLPIEQLLLFARGFAGHWDTALAALSPVDYRRMLLRMLGRVGFQRWDSDDPEVEDHPMNFLAVRAGRDAPSSSLLALAERVLATRSDAWR